MGHGLCRNCYNKARYYAPGSQVKEQMQAYASQHPEMRAAIWRKHAYGLTEAQWFALYQKYNGRCGICEKPEPINVLNIDHDHTTNVVRGLLCGHCNKGLGLFRDNPQRLREAAAYLERATMPRKRDPVVAVTRFFEEAPMHVAEVVLTLVTEIVRRRRPKARVVEEKSPLAPSSKPKPKSAPKPKSSPVTEALGAPAPAAGRGLN